MAEPRTRILVADDEPSIRFVLREALEEAGHNVVDVDSGNAAWEARRSKSHLWARHQPLASMAARPGGAGAFMA